MSASSRSDGSALEAAGALGLAERAMCLADALQLCGLSHALPRQHQPEFFRHYIGIGRQRFVTGRGLA